MKMESENVQLVEHIAEGEPLVVETTTTTTTTTIVTKRICIPKDMNVGLTDMQSVLNVYQNKNENPANVASHIFSNKVTLDEARGMLENHESKQENSLLSSTKIADGFDHEQYSCIDEVEISPEKETKLKRNKRTTNKKYDSRVNMEPIIEENRKTRQSKKVFGDKDKYINGLIDEYITLKEKPGRTQMVKVEEKREDLAIDKNLSAIFENSAESSPTFSGVESSSQIEFDEIQNENCSPVNEPSIEKEEPTRKKRKVNSGNSRKATKVKKTSAEKKNTIPPKDPKALSSGEPSEEDSLIKIYSPSIRGNLKSGKKITLTKKMIEQKLQKHSKGVLQRLGQSNEITIDANSRLIYVPTKKDDEESVNDDDILMNLQKKSKPLLIKEVHAK